MVNTIFKYVNSTHELPIFGFKIHISATWNNYKKITKLMLQYLSTKDISYKYIPRSQDVFSNFSITETSAESGKLFTLYPTSREECLIILEELYQYLPKEENGIYILSDRPYKDSKNIFYRYGTFKESLEYLENGLMTIRGSDGSVWQDYQKSYYDLPFDIKDLEEPRPEVPSKLANYLRVTKVLKKCNGGSVYQGKMLVDSKSVILKEAMPFIMFNKQISKSDLREREYQLSHEFSNYISQPIDKVTEWINNYYIYEYIDGRNLYEESTKYSVFAMDSNDREGNVSKFKKFIAIVEKIFELVSYFHERDYIIHDIHPDNFIINQDEEVFLIDIEMIYSFGDSFIPIQSEIALASWNKLDGKVADCYKLGNMILYLAGKFQVSTDFEKNISILEEITYCFGLKTTIGKVLKYLFSPEANIKVAQKLLRELKVEIHQEETNLNFFQMSPVVDFKGLSGIIDVLCPQFYEFYKNEIRNEIIFYHLDKEKNIGLDGLLGILYKMVEYSFDDEIIEYIIAKILSSLRDVEKGKSLQFMPGYCSPYLINGSAGVIKVLMTIDIDRFSEIILSLADSLCFEFAQRPGYIDGMLGCIDALLDVYYWTKNKKYLFFAEKQLTIVSIYWSHDSIETLEFVYLYQRLVDCMEGI